MEDEEEIYLEKNYIIPPAKDYGRTLIPDYIMQISLPNSARKETGERIVIIGEKENK